MLLHKEERDAIEEKALLSKKPNLDELLILWFSHKEIEKETWLKVMDILAEKYIKINKYAFLNNLYQMIENWKFSWEFNKKVQNIIEKNDTELTKMWLDIYDIVQIRNLLKK